LVKKLDNEMIELYHFAEKNKSIISYEDFNPKELKTKHSGTIQGHYNYFLFEKDEIVYIGSSSNLVSRILTHKMYINFDRVLILKYKKRKTAFSWEVKLIKYFQPKLNVRSK